MGIRMLGSFPRGTCIHILIMYDGPRTEYGFRCGHPPSIHPPSRVSVCTSIYLRESPTPLCLPHEPAPARVGTSDAPWSGWSRSMLSNEVWGWLCCAPIAGNLRTATLKCHRDTGIWRWVGWGGGGGPGRGQRHNCAVVRTDRVPKLPRAGGPAMQRRFRLLSSTL
jgi:hypothetical protein